MRSPFEFTRYGQSGTEISELDLVVYAGLPYGFEVGYIEYQFPQTAFGDTREFYVTWTRDMVITPTVSFYYDFGEVDSAYSSLDLAYAFPFQGKFSLGLGGLMAVAGKGWGEIVGGTRGGFFNYDVFASAGYQVSAIPLATTRFSVSIFPGKGDWTSMVGSTSCRTG